jgi:hypothetical protein
LINYKNFSKIKITCRKILIASSFLLCMISHLGDSGMTKIRRGIPKVQAVAMA